MKAVIFLFLAQSQKHVILMIGGKKIYVLSNFCRHGQKVPIVDDEDIFREAGLNGGLPQYLKGRVKIVFLNPFTI